MMDTSRWSVVGPQCEDEAVQDQNVIHVRRHVDDTQYHARCGFQQASPMKSSASSAVLIVAGSWATLEFGRRLPPSFRRQTDMRNFP